MSNPDGQSAEYKFLWLPRGGGGYNSSNAASSEIFSLGANMTVRYSNVLSEVFGFQADSLGALLVLSTNPHLLFMSRTYNIQRADSGTCGQAMPAVSQGDFMSRGEKRRIVFGSESTDLRTNIGCQNGSVAGGVTVNLELFSNDGTSLETKSMILGPLGNDQINRIFGDFGPINGCVDVWTEDEGALVYCYGSVLDNRTNDPTTIPAQ